MSTEGSNGARLPYWPGLDGLRALAVVAVLAYHQGFGWAAGGFLGVSVFFTLSGFLITSLLLAERSGSGTIRLRSFWARRARRLAPAGLLALVLAVIATVVAVPPQQQGEAINDIRAALGNIANWRFVFAGVPYADLIRVPSPVQHFWSLAIEEQFYVVFPIVALIALRRRRSALGIVLAAVVVGSVALQLWFGAGDRTYYGTDTRAAELAIGGLLAMVRPQLVGHVTLARWRLADVGGAVGLVAMVLLMWGAQLSDPALYAGAFVGIAVVSAMVVLGAVDGTMVGRLLSIRPLPAIGRISYGVYVFHLPLYLLLSEDRTGLQGVPLFLVRIAATFGLAVASYALLESPIRSRRALPRPRVALPAFAGAVAVLLVALPFASGPSARPSLITLGAEVTSPPPSTVSTVPVGAAPAVGENVASVPAPPGDGPAAPAPDEAAPVASEQPLAARPVRLLVVGDSTARANGQGLAAWGAKNGLVSVDIAANSGCTVLRPDRGRLREGVEFTPPDCTELFDQAVGRAQDVDAVVFFIGSPQLSDGRYFGDPRWRSIDDPQVAMAYQAALGTLIDKFATSRRPVLWADVPTPNWDLDGFFKALGSPPQGTGPATMNSPVRAGAINGLDAAVLSARPSVSIVPYTALLAALDAKQGHPIRDDGMHLSLEAAAYALDNGLWDALRASYDVVGADPRADTVMAQGTVWRPA